MTFFSKNKLRLFLVTLHIFYICIGTLGHTHFLITRGDLTISACVCNDHQNHISVNKYHICATCVRTATSSQLLSKATVDPLEKSPSKPTPDILRTKTRILSSPQMERAPPFYDSISFLPS